MQPNSWDIRNKGISKRLENLHKQISRCRTKQIFDQPQILQDHEKNISENMLSVFFLVAKRKKFYLLLFKSSIEYWTSYSDANWSLTKYRTDLMVGTLSRENLCAARGLKGTQTFPVLGWTQNGAFSKWLAPFDTFISSLG